MYASHLNQCRRSGSVGGGASWLLRVVEAAAVDAPVLADDPLLRPSRRRQAEVEADEVGRRRRSRRSPRRRAAAGTRGRPGLSGSPRPPVPRDRAERPCPRLQLLLASPPEPLAQHRDSSARVRPSRRRRTRSRSGARTPRSAAPAPRAPRARRPAFLRGLADTRVHRERGDLVRLGSASATSSAEPSGSERPASSSTSRVRPENSGVNSATSAAAVARARVRRRAAARGSGRRRGRPPARPA